MNTSFLKSIIYSFLIDPLFYFCSILTVIYTSFSFFYLNHFFVLGVGTTELDIFFKAISISCIIIIPLLVFRIRYFIFDDSIPLNSFSKLITILFSVFVAAIIPVLVLISIPVTVNVFGFVDVGQFISGFIGIVLFILTAISFVIFIFNFFNKGYIALLISILFLIVFNNIHLIPLYLKLNSFFNFFFKQFSFAWHFSSFENGIIDTKDIFFFLFTTLIFTLLSIYAEYKRIGKKIDFFAVVLLFLSILFSVITFSKFYKRFDFTVNKQYTISQTTKKLTSKLESPLRITYFQSNELKDYYPQSTEIIKYLENFASQTNNVFFNVEKADSKKLNNLGIQGQQIKNQTGTKIEYVTVYSTILLQYVDKSTLIPFILSIDSIEYDLSQRIQQLISQKERNLYIISGNGKSIDTYYSYVQPYLISKGFKTFVVKDIIKELENINEDSQLLIFGSNKLSIEQSNFIKEKIESGISAFIATSPFTPAIESDWNIQRNYDDYFLKILNSWGFVFDKSLIQDISCFPLTMQTENSTLEYKTVNYPLWVSILPQNYAPKGLTVFWSSPILLYNDTYSLIKTTNNAWKQTESNDKDLPFLVNPFLIPKTAYESGAKSEQFNVVSKKSSENMNITVISDQFFVSSILTGFISSENFVDFRNYDFLASELLNLKKENELSELMNKSKIPLSLYKITDLDLFENAKNNSIVLNFIIIPFVFIISFFIFQILRKKR